MGRPEIEPGKIREVISKLDAEGKSVSVTSIRERLGSGSYSTFSAVLAEWRKERAKAVLPTVPAMPEGVSHLVEHLWAEAWKAADSIFDPERRCSSGNGPSMSSSGRRRTKRSLGSKRSCRGSRPSGSRPGPPWRGWRRA